MRSVVQKDGMDDVLRTGLWNAQHQGIWREFQYRYIGRIKSSNLETLFWLYWCLFFKKPLDTMPTEFSHAVEQIRKYFFEDPWYSVYDFIEFTANNCPENLRHNFVHICNSVLERELSAYRLVGLYITEITSEEEIGSVEAAISQKGKYSAVSEHIQTALRFLSNRKSPDYRNSVKESISAVEALCRLITGNQHSTLGEALKEIDHSNQMHSAFKTALSKLYGYTSDAEGIRHSLLEESSVTFDDAMFMLVVCSAFVNYMLRKSSINDL